jgi:hypothetical protein
MYHTLLEPAFIFNNPRYYKSVYECWISDEIRDLNVDLYVLFRDVNKVIYLVNVKRSLPEKARDVYCGMS